MLIFLLLWVARAVRALRAERWQTVGRHRHRIVEMGRHRHPCRCSADVVPTERTTGNMLIKQKAKDSSPLSTPSLWTRFYDQICRGLESIDCEHRRGQISDKRISFLFNVFINNFRTNQALIAQRFASQSVCESESESCLKGWHGL